MTSISRVLFGVLIGAVFAAVLGLLVVRSQISGGAFSVVALTLTLIVAEVFKQRERGQLAAHLSQIWHNRPRLSPEEFGRRYFQPANAPTAAALRELLQKSSGRDFSQLRPSDEFLVLLGAESFNPQGRDHFLGEVGEEFGVRLDSSAVSTHLTFESFLHHIHQQAAKSKSVNDLDSANLP